MTLPFFLVKVFHFWSIYVIVLFLILSLIPSSGHFGPCPPFLLSGLVSQLLSSQVLLCGLRGCSQTLIHVLPSPHRFSLLSLDREARSYKLYWESRLLSFIFIGSPPKCNLSSKYSPFTNTCYNPTLPLKPFDEKNRFSFMAAKSAHAPPSLWTEFVAHLGKPCGETDCVFCLLLTEWYTKLPGLWLSGKDCTCTKAGCIQDPSLCWWSYRNGSLVVAISAPSCSFGLWPKFI